MTTPTRPVLRYHGGKWRLAPFLIRHFPPHRVYVEPYMGACSVLMRKPRSYAEVVNDLDTEIVNVFRVLRDDEQAARLERLLRLTPFAREEFDTSYDLPTADPVEWARSTIIRSLMGFGSDGTNDARATGFRANSNRSHTTPAHDWASYPNLIKAFTDRLRGVVIENRSAQEIIAQQDSAETLFYVDPPYPHKVRTGEKAYRHEMSEADHRELAATLHEVEGMVALSGYPCALYDEELFRGWCCVRTRALADGALKRTEALWLSPRTVARLPQQCLLFDVAPEDQFPTAAG